MKELNELIICACNCPEHQLLFRTVDGDEDIEVFVSIHLCRVAWYKRIWRGLKYIFGHTSRYGHFDEIILFPEHAKQLKKVVKYLEQGNTKKKCYEQNLQGHTEMKPAAMKYQDIKPEQ